MYRCVLGVVLAAVLAGDGVQEHKLTVKIERETLIDTDTTLVVRLLVTAPACDDAEVTRLSYAYGNPSCKDIRNNVSNGIWPRDTEERRAEVLIVAQMSPGAKEFPPMLMLTTQQKSCDSTNGGALTSEAHRLDADKKKLKEVLTVDVESGEYPLGKQIRIGKLAVDPIYLSVEAERQS